MSPPAGSELALLVPLAAALSYSVAAIVQQVGARRTTPGRRLGVRLLGDLLRQPLFLAGVALDGLGFSLAFVGLQGLPLFVVQAVVASTVAMTAVLGRRFLGDRLSGRDWTLIGTIVGGLTLVGVSAADGEAPAAGAVGTVLLVAGVPALALAARALEGRSAAALAALSGVAFGGFALAARLFPGGGAGGAPTEPPLLAAVAYAGLGLALYGAALQRGSVTVVTATAIATEALVPSVLGLVLLGDGPRPGWAGAAAVGFLLTVGGAVGLAVSRSPVAPARLPEPGRDETRQELRGCASLNMR